MDNKKSAALFVELLELVKRLRSPRGCPWDRAQTVETIAPYLLEETHEVLEAIAEKDNPSLRDELGDLMLEFALLCRISEEAGHFDAADALRAINAKLVRRHPHVFGEESGQLVEAAQVNKRWSELKAEEKPERSALGGVPKSLPALHRARRVSEKAASVGFDWPEALQVLAKVEEECAELRAALASGDRTASGEEFGDLLFALVSLGRHLGLDPERSLNATTDKFLRRFSHVEGTLKAKGKKPSESTLEEMDILWEEAKKLE